MKKSGRENFLSEIAGPTRLGALVSLLIRLSLRFFWLGGGFIALALASFAAVADPPRSFDVPAGDAAATLKLAARQGNLEIAFFVETVRGVRTRELRGSFAPREALARLVAGTGLVLVADDSTGAITVRRDKSATLTTAPPPPQTSPPNSSASMKPRTPFSALGAWLALALAAPPAPAADGPTGIIEGRVLNATSDSYLNNAQVSVEGTRLTASTNANGEFRFAAVPAGPVRLVVRFTGLRQQSAALVVTAGETVSRDFILSRDDTPGTTGDDTVRLDQFVVASSREMNAADIANNEQRYAPNLKNVVDADAFGDAGEGNLGEFIKFVPGVTVNYASFDARTISVRGLPPDTTPILIDGNPVASAVSSGATREIEVGGLMMNNISRVEVSKTPTPDAPANSLGGTVNVVNKGAFDRAKPSFTYHVNSIMNSNWLTLRSLPGGQPETTGRRILPGADFSYIAPFSKTFGVTVNGFYTRRYSGTQMTQSQWRPAGGSSGYGTAENPFLNGHTINDQPTQWLRYSLGATLDWKLGRRDHLSIGTQFTSLVMNQNIEQWNTSLTGTSTMRPLGYDSTFAQSGVGAGSSLLTTNARRKTDRTWHSSVKYRHPGPVWQLDGGAAFSRSTNSYRDIDFGYFSSARVQARNLNLRYTAINTVRKGPGLVTATTTAGVPVDLTSLANYSLVYGGSNQLSSSDALASAHLNARRDLPLRLPVQLRAGAAIARQDRDIRGQAPTWNFVGPDGVANSADDSVARYDLVDPVYSRANVPFDLPALQRPSPYKLWALYRAHPEYFRLDEVASIARSTGNSRKITETISAAYLRFDTRLFSERLALTGGVRFERTVDDAFGLLQDVRAIYQQDAQGNLLRDSAGRPIRLTNDAVQLARLQYHDRGAHARRDYSGFYPSLNATWHFTTDFRARAACSRTIGRPNFSEIIPNTSVSDPNASDATRAITIVNTGLKPWTGVNYDVALEYYFEHSGRVALSGFRKELRNFFGATRTDATPELLAQFGLSDDYLDYDVITKENIGEACVTGVEFDYQQSLAFLPLWARGTMVFFNLTKTHLEGNSTADFSGFTRESINWGISLSRPRFNLKLAWNYRGRQRLGQVTGNGVAPGTYSYNPEYLTLNVNAEYRFTRRFAVYTVIRNIANKPLVTEAYGPITPTYARVSNYQHLGSQISLGIKGEF